MSGIIFKQQMEIKQAWLKRRLFFVFVYANYCSKQ